MSRVAGVAVTALLIAASPLAYAQAPSAGATEGSSAADRANVTDARVELTKAALQLTPDQEKYWPAVEAAIRDRAKNRQGRMAKAAERSSEMHEKSRIEVLRDRNPVDFMQRRADALGQRSADLKKLADAWQPLYQTLTPEQKRRLALVTILVVHDVRSAADARHDSSEDEDEE